MSMLVWVMMGIALWHFTIWLPDHFWGGIVGAFLAATFGSVIFGLIVAGFSIPGRHDTDIVQALIAIPGACAGLAAAYYYGLRQEQQQRKPPARTKPARG